MPIVILPEPEASGYVTLAQLRSLPNLGDETRFTDDDLAEALEWFETRFEEYTGMAFLPRQATQRLSGSGCSSLMLDHWPVRSVSAVRIYSSATASTAYTVDELADVYADPTGEITRVTLGAWPYGNRNVEVDYVHGQAAPTPAIRREAKVAIQEYLLERNSGRPTDRTYGVATDGVFVRSILPDGDKHPFGIASVDALAVRMRAKYKLPAIA